MDSYRVIPNKLADLEPVHGNSLTAGFESDGLYWVRSYSTAIAVYDPRDRTLYVNDGRYSVTTSRHQGTLYMLIHRTAAYVVDVSGCGYTPQHAWDALRAAVENNAPAPV